MSEVSDATTPMTAVLQGIEGVPTHMRAWALVGGYLQFWALVEDAIQQGIGKCLGLRPIQVLILAPNINLAQQVYVLRSAADYYPPNPGKDKFLSALKSVLNEAQSTRNMMAHSLFGWEDDMKAVQFYRIQARERLQVSAEVWTVDTFHQRYEKLTRLASDIQNYIKNISPRDELIKAMLVAGIKVGAGSAPLEGAPFGLLNLSNE